MAAAGTSLESQGRSCGLLRASAQCGQMLKGINCKSRKGNISQMDGKCNPARNPAWVWLFVQPRSPLRLFLFAKRLGSSLIVAYPLIKPKGTSMINSVTDLLPMLNARALTFAAKHVWVKAEPVTNPFTRLELVGISHFQAPSRPDPA